MSVYRRLLLMIKLTESGGELVIDFTDGIVTINSEGNGNKTTISGSEVILSE